MKQVTDLPHQENFIAFVSKESMMNVSKYLSQLIVNPQLFLDYQRPPQVIKTKEDEGEEVTDGYVKKFALAKSVFDDTLGQDPEMPFRHHSKNDILKLEHAEHEILKKVSLVETFKDFSGLELELTPNDYLPESKFRQNLQQHEDPAEIEAYLKSEEGGKGQVKCYPMSYIQGNFAYYHLKKLEKL